MIIFISTFSNVLELKKKGREMDESLVWKSIKSQAVKFPGLVKCKRTPQKPGENGRGQNRGVCPAAPGERLPRREGRFT